KGTQRLPTEYRHAQGATVLIASSFFAALVFICWFARQTMTTLVCWMLQTLHRSLDLTGKRSTGVQTERTGGGGHREAALIGYTKRLLMAIILANSGPLLRR